MSEYWKSTPRVWCKHCKLFYRDTPFDTQQHNNTGKHQSSVQRSIRNLHKDTEREERNAQRAKDEVARLNGIVSGKPTPSGSRNGSKKPSAAGATASEGERKRQIAQLAAMGVAVPEEFRREMALAGEWGTVGERRIEAVKEEDGNVGTEYERSVGVRKRKAEDDEDGEEAAMPATNGATDRRRGSRRKTLAEDEEDVDIGSLMGKSEEVEGATNETLVKKEEDEPDAENGALEPAMPEMDTERGLPVPVKQEDSFAPPPVVFKKRKSKIKTGG